MRNAYMIPISQMFKLLNIQNAAGRVEISFSVEINEDKVITNPELIEVGIHDAVYSGGNLSNTIGHSHPGILNGGSVLSDADLESLVKSGDKWTPLLYLDNLWIMNVNGNKYRAEVTNDYSKKIFINNEVKNLLIPFVSRYGWEYNGDELVLNTENIIRFLNMFSLGFEDEVSSEIIKTAILNAVSKLGYEELIFMVRKNKILSHMIDKDIAIMETWKRFVEKTKLKLFKNVTIKEIPWLLALASIPNNNGYNEDIEHIKVTECLSIYREYVFVLGEDTMFVKIENGKVTSSGKKSINIITEIANHNSWKGIEIYGDEMNEEILVKVMYSNWVNSDHDIVVGERTYRGRFSEFTPKLSCLEELNVPEHIYETEKWLATSDGVNNVFVKVVTNLEEVNQRWIRVIKKLEVYSKESTLWLYAIIKSRNLGNLRYTNISRQELRNIFCQLNDFELDAKLEHTIDYGFEVKVNIVDEVTFPLGYKDKLETDFV